jgi:hypothetical protein
MRTGTHSYAYVCVTLYSWGVCRDLCTGQAHVKWLQSEGTLMFYPFYAAVAVRGALAHAQQQHGISTWKLWNGHTAKDANSTQTLLFAQRRRETFSCCSGFTNRVCVFACLSVYKSRGLMFR